MGFATKNHISVHGRLLGIQSLSSAESGATRGNRHYVVGTFMDVRPVHSTDDTTAVNLHPCGMSQLGTTSTSSTANTFTLDPPIPGLRKLIAVSCGSSEGTILIRTANFETIESTAGSSFTSFVVSTRGLYELYGVTTARWMTHHTSVHFTLLATH